MDELRRKLEQLTNAMEDAARTAATSGEIDVALERELQDALGGDHFVTFLFGQFVGRMIARVGAEKTDELLMRTVAEINLHLPR